MSEKDKTEAKSEHRDPTSPPRTERGADDRRGEVWPKDDPAPSSPTADREAVEKGEQVLDRVKPY